VDPNYFEKIDCLEFESFDDEQATLNSLIEQYRIGKRPYETIINDGITFQMNNIKSTLEQDRYHAKELEEKTDKQPRPGLVDLASLEMKDWGTLSSLTARSVGLLHQLSKFGVMVVTTAIAEEFPKWNKTITIGPSLLGKAFPNLIHGWYDTIGYIIRPFGLDSTTGQFIKPRVSFISPGGGSGFLSAGYMVRANPRLIAAEQKYGPLILDLTILSKIIRGELE
jgi:hypothetical protein